MIFLGEKDTGRTETLAAIEQALYEITKVLEGMQVRQVLDRVSQADEVGVEWWTRIRNRDATTNTSMIQAKVLQDLTGRFRRQQKVVVEDRVWHDAEAKSKHE